MRKLLDLFRRSALERRMQEEFDHHMEMLVQEYRKQGHSPEEARRRAQREFGRPELQKTFARRYLPRKNPLGASVIEHCGGKTSRTIVGVVADVRTNSLKSKLVPTMYIPVSQASDPIIKSAHTWFPMS